MSYLWMDDRDFREIELDRDSRIPDEPYDSLCVDRVPRSMTDDGAARPEDAPARSTEGDDVEGGA